jgi:hypothetical protein
MRAESTSSIKLCLGDLRKSVGDLRKSVSASCYPDLVCCIASCVGAERRHLLDWEWTVLKLFPTLVWGNKECTGGLLYVYKLTNVLVGQTILAEIKICVGDVK